MENFDLLAEFINEKRENLHAKLEAIDKELPRSEYLRHKTKLRDSKEFRELQGIRSPALESDIADTEQALGVALPAKLKEFYKISSWYDGEYTSGVCIQPIKSLVRLSKHNLQLITLDELYPPIYKHKLEFSEWSKLSISVWQSPDQSSYSGKVILNDHADRMFYLISHSVGNYLYRIIDAIVNGYEIDFFNPSAAELNFIKGVEKQSVFPLVDEIGITRFSFDETDKFLPEWKVFLSIEDNNFSIDPQI